MQPRLSCSCSVSAPFGTFPNEREITGEPVKNTCCKALQELEFYYLLSCMVGKFFRNLKYSVLQHQNNLSDEWESVAISSVNSDFQGIKLEEKRLLLSSNSWKCPTRVKSLIWMWEVCAQKRGKRGEGDLHFYTVFVPPIPRAFSVWKDCPCDHV